MGAPKGNQFWKLRSKHGRDKLFKTPKLLYEAACEYFQWCIDNPLIEVEQAKQAPKPYRNDKGELIMPSNLIELPKMRAFTIQGLCLYLDCNVLYFSQFESSLKDKKDKISKDFSIVVTRIREIIYNQKFTGAASGFLNPNIIARDLGLKEQTENKHGFDEEMQAFLKPFKEKD